MVKCNEPLILPQVNSKPLFIALFVLLIISCVILWVKSTPYNKARIFFGVNIGLLALTVCTFIFFSTADETTLNKMGCRVERTDLKTINNTYNCKLIADTEFYLTKTTTQQDLENFIKSNKSAIDLVIYDNTNNEVYSIHYKKPNAEEIYKTYNEWQSTGKIGSSETRAYFSIFYLDQF